MYQMATKGAVVSSQRKPWITALTAPAQEPPQLIAFSHAAEIAGRAWSRL